MSLEELKAQQQTLVLQRAAAKDQVEQTERALQQIGFALQVLEAQAKDKSPEEPTED